MFTRHLGAANRFAALADVGQVAVDLRSSGLEALCFSPRTKTVAIGFGS